MDLAALENRNAAIIDALVEAGADPTVRSKSGFSALDLAVSNNNPAVVTALMRAGSKVRTQFESSGDSSEDSLNPLTLPIEFFTYGILPHLCIAVAENENPAVINALVEAGADPTVRTKNGSTPLHLAAARGYGVSVAIIAALRDAGADPTIRNDEDKLPWDYAEEHSTIPEMPEHTDIYRWLKGASSHE